FADTSEVLFCRCDPKHLDGDKVIPSAVEQFDLSVLRARYCSDPDHARWDSRVDAGGKAPLVYPEFSVIQFSVLDASPQRIPENEAAQVHSMHPVHHPFSDNYAHCELGLFRGKNAEQRLKVDQAKNREAKLAKTQFRAHIADRARVRLRPQEGSSFRHSL